MTHSIILETRNHWLGHAWRCTCGRPRSTWMESEATARAAFRKHAKAAARHGYHGSFAHVQSIYQAARRAVPYEHSGDGDPVLRRQPWLRKVQREFDRRLKEAGVEVEGLE